MIEKLDALVEVEVSNGCARRRPQVLEALFQISSLGRVDPGKDSNGRRHAYKDSCTDDAHFGDGLEARTRNPRRNGTKYKRGKQHDCRVPHQSGHGACVFHINHAYVGKVRRERERERKREREREREIEVRLDTHNDEMRTRMHACIYFYS